VTDELPKLEQRIAVLESQMKRLDIIETKAESLRGFKTTVITVATIAVALGIVGWVVQKDLGEKVGAAHNAADAAAKTANAANISAADAAKTAASAQDSAASAEKRRDAILSELDSKKRALMADAAKGLEPAIAQAKAAIAEASRTILPVGTILTFAGPAASLPEGTWLQCDGRPTRSVELPELFKAIGRYWGDGSKQSDGGCACPSGGQTWDHGPRTPLGKGAVNEIGTIEAFTTGSPIIMPGGATPLIYTPVKTAEAYISVTNIPTPSAISPMAFNPETRPVNVAVRFYIRAR
jgi:hypothetical protein